MDFLKKKYFTNSKICPINSGLVDFDMLKENLGSSKKIKDIIGSNSNWANILESFSNFPFKIWVC